MAEDNILLTGSTGFLGKIIFEKLNGDYQITSISRQPKITRNINFDFAESNQLILNDNFKIVIHCAGKAHSIPKTESEKAEFYKVNYTGTQKLLEALDKSEKKPVSFIFISTVAVYGLSTGKNINEDEPLNGDTPYAKSKIIAEEIIENWCKKYEVKCTILRLPILIGKNPKGNLETMINGINKGRYFNIGGGKARKSMVLAEDVAMFIPSVSKIGGIYNLTDGYHPNFMELSMLIAKQLGKPNPLNIPKPIIFILAKIGDLLGNLSPINSNIFRKITYELTFDDSKASKLANWNPTPVLQGFKIK